MVIGYTDYVDDAHVKFNTGWAYCLIIIQLILVNLATIIYFTVKEFI